jgi:toxin FitB
VTGWLLDTNILSELRRTSRAQSARFHRSASARQLVSAVTFAEVRFSIELIDDTNKRADELNHWLAHKVAPMFEHRSLPVTTDAMFKWRLLVEEAARRGVP